MTVLCTSKDVAVPLQMAIQQLQSFSAAAACTKCGAHTISTSYCAAASTDTPSADTPSRMGALGRLPIEQEHLRRTCRGCGYAWLEAVQEEAATVRDATVRDAAGLAGKAREPAPSQPGRTQWAVRHIHTPVPRTATEHALEAVIEEIYPSPSKMAPASGAAPTQLALITRSPALQEPNGGFATGAAPSGPAPSGPAPSGPAPCDRMQLHPMELPQLELTLTQLNAGIARAVGWRYSGPCNLWIKPEGGTQREPPNYCGEVNLAWELMSHVKTISGHPGVRRWTDYLEQQQPEWCHLSDVALALRLAQAFYFAHFAQSAAIVADEE